MFDNILIEYAVAVLIASLLVDVLRALPFMIFLALMIKIFYDVYTTYEGEIDD